MFTNKIFCVGDGYAHGYIWPEWPQILKSLLPDFEVNVISAVGAGNEFLISELIACGDKIQNQQIIFQWAQHNRFDKLIEDTKWNDIMLSDPVYHFNWYQHENRKWWCSSASKNVNISNYHKFYIQSQQSKLRLVNQKILVESYLKIKNCKYFFTSTNEQELFSKKQQSLRGNEIQPSPVSHLLFVTEILLPAMDISVSAIKLNMLKERIYNHIWIPYDPDQEEIWRNMSIF
jgi:hypothetical protein